MNILYLTLGVLGFLLCLLVLIFSSRSYSRLIDDKHFIIFQGSYGKFGRIFGKTLAVGLSYLGLFLMGLLFFNGLLGTPDTNDKAYKLVTILAIGLIVIPVSIICVFSALKTKRLAKAGHLTAGYLNYKINARFNLLRILSILPLVIVFILGMGLIPIYFANVNGLAGKIVGYSMLVLIVIFCILAGFWDKILHNVMKKNLGNYVKVDYDPIIKIALKEGISEEQFYQRMFSASELKRWKKDKEQISEGGTDGK